MLISKMVQWIKTVKKNHRIFILDMITAVLVVFLLILAVSAAGELNDAAKSFYHDEEAFYYRMEAGNYSDMVRMYHENEAAGRGGDKALQEYYGVAEYFEAALNYKMYANTERQDTVLREQQKMEAAYVQMGDFAFIREKIDEKLGLPVDKM